MLSNFSNMSNKLEVGMPLPDWSLEPIFDEIVPSLQSFRGKPLMILFFSLGCPGCLGRAIPYANRLVYEYGEQLPVVGIHTNFEGVDFEKSRFEQAQKEFYIRFSFFKDYNFNTTFLDYQAGGTPHWILLDREGKIAYTIFGSDPNNALLRLDLRITEILNQ